MPLESGADGEARMETDQPWVGVRVPERAGCWPPARSIPASLLLQGWVLAPRLQHPCFSPACLLPLSHPFPGRHFLNMKQKKQIVTYNLLPCQRRCIF